MKSQVLLIVFSALMYGCLSEPSVPKFTKKPTVNPYIDQLSGEVFKKFESDISKIEQSSLPISYPVKGEVISVMVTYQDSKSEEQAVSFKEEGVDIVVPCVFSYTKVVEKLKITKVDLQNKKFESTTSKVAVDPVYKTGALTESEKKACATFVENNELAVGEEEQLKFDNGFLIENQNKLATFLKEQIINSVDACEKKQTVDTLACLDIKTKFTEGKGRIVYYDFDGKMKLGYPEEDRDLMVKFVLNRPYFPYLGILNMSGSKFIPAERAEFKIKVLSLESWLVP